MPMRVTVSLHPHAKIGLAPEWAKEQVERGYDGLWYGEAKHNPFLALTLMAEHTEQIRFGSNVAVAFARSPYVTANHAWDLQDYSGGRFILGLGTQVKGHNERRFSVPWGPPSPRLREYVECMKAIWHTWQTGDKPNYEGKYYRYSLDAWNWNPGPIEHPDIPVVIAAVRPRNTRLAAEVCDGVLWHGMMSFAYRDQVLLPELEEGARRSGRDLKDLVVSGGGFVITAKDEELLREQMAEQKRWMSFYASTRTYQDSMKMAGLEEEANLLHRLSIDQEWDEMVKVISDDFLAEYAVIATWDELVPKLRERYGGINTEIQFRADLSTPEDEDQIREIISQIKQIPSYGEVEPSFRQTAETAGTT